MAVSPQPPLQVCFRWNRGKEIIHLLVWFQRRWGDMRCRRYWVNVISYYSADRAKTSLKNTKNIKAASMSSALGVLQMTATSLGGISATVHYHKSIQWNKYHIIFQRLGNACCDRGMMDYWFAQSRWLKKRDFFFLHCKSKWLQCHSKLLYRKKKSNKLQVNSILHFV